MFLAKNFHKDIRPRLEANTLVHTRNVLVFAWDRKSEVDKRTALEGAEVLSFHPVRLGRESKLGLTMGAVAFQVMLVLATVRFAARIKERPIVHAHDFNTLIPGIILRKLGLSSALVYDCHEFSFAAYNELFNPLMGKIVQVLEEHLVKYADVVITVSNPVAKYLSQFGRRANVIYNCPKKNDAPTISKRDARTKLRLPHDKFIIASIGEIRYDSTVDVLFKAFSSELVHQTKLHLLIIGHKGPLGHHILDANEEPKENVTILPYVERRTALTYTSASDIVWAVYRSEGYASWNPRLTLPWKFFDALACGVPMIVEARTLRSELVNKFDCGWVLNRLESESISKLLLDISANPDLYQSRVQATRLANSKLNISWERMSEELVRIYDKLH
jgi:glycosyltransferase involved in cell wall biosynthesis